MAKKRGKKKGKSRKKDRKSKAKRRKFISKISRDGKISKKEGRKAAKKGISLRKIKNRRISDHREASRNYQRNVKPSARNSSGQRKPSYEPLKIKRGAQQADDRLRGRSSSSRRSSSKPKSTPKVRSSEPSAPTSNYASQANDLLADYDNQLAQITGTIDESSITADPLTFQYAASSLVEPGNNLTIGAATDAEKTASADKFKRRRKKRGSRLLRQIKKQRSNFGGFTGTAPALASAGTAASSFGNI